MLRTALVFLALMLAQAAQADDSALCPAGATVTSKFVKNSSGLPVKIEVTTPGSPAITISETAQLPPGVVCRAMGRITVLADASTDKGRSFHRVMTRTAPAAFWSKPRRTALTAISLIARNSRFRSNRVNRAGKPADLAAKVPGRTLARRMHHR
ncbi:MAG TPA: hypothetical protein VGI89_06265 [Rhizomicrobium sp.]|jgi:hypothetical protein